MNKREGGGGLGVLHCDASHSNSRTNTRTQPPHGTNWALLSRACLPQTNWQAKTFLPIEIVIDRWAEQKGGLECANQLNFHQFITAQKEQSLKVHSSRQLKVA